MSDKPKADNAWPNLMNGKKRLPEGVKNAMQLISRVEYFIANLEEFTGNREAEIKSLQKEIYITRLNLAYNKKTESNTGKLDNELCELSDRIGTFL